MNTYSPTVKALLILTIALNVTLVKTNAIQSRIISGMPAASGQFPWHVVLKKDEYDRLLCGGSIISDSWVLTAAHCTYGLTSLLLLFGTIELDDTTNNMTSTQFFIHPKYNPKYLSNDISLIQLPTPLNFTRTVQPIRLVSLSQAMHSFVGFKAIIAGFGVTDDEYLEYSEILLWAQVEIIGNSYCESIFGKDIVKETNICSQSDGNTNTSICSGDSGGALIIITNGTAAQIGIDSFVARDMCTERYPASYVRLTSYLNYISSITGITLV